MKNDLNKRAVYSVVTPENKMFQMYDAKIGTGVISIFYDLINDDYLEDDNCVGEINVYSDGYINCVIDNPKYASTIYNDYLKISGNNKALKCMYITASTLDKKRWEKAKEYINNNNIITRFQEDLLIEKEEKERKLQKKRRNY